MNLSSKQLLQPDLVKQIDRNIKEANLDASRLRLEISESIVRENPDSAIAVLSQLKALGIQLQIDNFGRNYSCYSCSHCLPNQFREQFDRLKVDRFLVSHIDNDGESLEIVRSIATNARDLGIDVIATGIETSKQFTQIKAMQCVYGQGYFFSKPIAGNAVKKLILSGGLAV
jgi:EAL domain-containing protein (putative c-di-GMP-specific phosphodiesterase class I)